MLCNGMIQLFDFLDHLSNSLVIIHFVIFLVGNCDMNAYRTIADDWWYVPMMMDDSPCGPECPPEGC